MLCPVWPGKDWIMVQRSSVVRLQRGKLLCIEACLLLRCQLVFMRLIIGVETQAHLPHWEGCTHAHTVISTLTHTRKHAHTSCEIHLSSGLQAECVIKDENTCMHACMHAPKGAG